MRVYHLECGLQDQADGVSLGVWIAGSCIWIADSCISVSGLQTRVSVYLDCRLVYQCIWIAGSCINWSVDCRLVYHLEYGLQARVSLGVWIAGSGR